MLWRTSFGKADLLEGLLNTERLVSSFSFGIPQNLSFTTAVVFGK